MRQNPHVRICGGPGSATTLVYLTLVRPGGKTRLRMTDNLPTRQTFTRIANALVSG